MGVIIQTEVFDNTKLFIQIGRNLTNLNPRSRPNYGE